MFAVCFPQSAGTASHKRPRSGSMTYTLCLKITLQHKDLQAFPWRKIFEGSFTSSLSLHSCISKQIGKHWPEQVVALLVRVGLQLHDRLVVLDEFEQLWGVQLGVAIVVWLRTHRGKSQLVAWAEKELRKKSFVVLAHRPAKGRQKICRYRQEHWERTPCSRKSSAVLNLTPNGCGAVVQH